MGACVSKQERVDLGFRTLLLLAWAWGARGGKRRWPRPPHEGEWVFGAPTPLFLSRFSHTSLIFARATPPHPFPKRKHRHGQQRVIL